MYQVGDVILYGTVGVCEIMEISAQNFPGSSERPLYYTLNPLFQKCEIRTPVENKKIFMRPVITKAEAERLINLIPTIQAEPCHEKASTALAEHYTSAIQTHDCESLLALTMSIYAKRQEQEEKKKKFGAVDERFMRQAEDLLFGELSVALGIAKDEVPAYIASKLASKADKAHAVRA